MAAAFKLSTVTGVVVLLSQTLVFAGDSNDASAPIEVRTDDIVVTATRFPETDLDRPINMTVISREEIERSPAKTVPEVLAAEVGFVNSELFGNNGANATVDSRGFGVTGGQNTLILVNGRRISDIDLSGVKWSSIPLAAVERIEIVRGSGSVLYGNGAVAGVVNIITRTTLDETNAATVGARIGTLATREAKANANYRSDKFGLSVSGVWYSSDGYRDNNENDESNIFVDARTLGESNDLSLQFGADRQYIRLPGARKVQPSSGLNELENDRRGTSTPLDYATRDGAYATLGLSSQQDFGYLDAELGYREKAQTSYYYYSPGSADYWETDLDVWSLTPRAKIPGTIGGRDNQLVLGVDVYNWDYARLVSNDPQNIATPINRVRAEQQNIGIYLHDTLQLTTPMTLSFGWREEWQSIDATDDFDPTAPGASFGSGAADGQQDLQEYAYDLGLRYDLAMGWAATVKTGRSFRFATIDEIYEFSPTSREYQFLRPQTAESVDFGVERRWTEKMLRATLFQIDVEDEIHLDSYSSGIGNTNLPPSRRKGIELESAMSLGDVGVKLTYAYTDAKFLEGVLPVNGVPVDIAGNTVPLVPRDKVTISADWTISEHSILTAAFRYVSDQYMDNDEPNDFYTKIPAYSVVDVKLARQQGRWRLGFVINNLFDEMYYTYAVRSTSSDAYNAYPLPERTVTVFAEYRFGYK